MKSIFFVKVFIVLAITVSQPDKAEVKYVPLSVSIPHSFVQNDLRKNFSINFVPDSKANSYKIILNDKLNQLVESSDINFLFSDCKLKQRPNLSISCHLKERSESSAQVIALSVKPMLTLGQEKVEFYIVELSRLSSNSETINYKLFTNSKNVLVGENNLNFKVTQIQ